MGAWDFTVFDDDTAYDALDDLRNTGTLLLDMERYFDTVLEDEYIDYDKGVYALVCAAVIDSAFNQTKYRCDWEEYFSWTQEQKELDFLLILDKAIEAIHKVIGPSSELQELWEQNESLFDSWVEDKVAIIERLKDCKATE